MFPLLIVGISQHTDTRSVPFIHSENKTFLPFEVTVQRQQMEIHTHTHTHRSPRPNNQKRIKRKTTHKLYFQRDFGMFLAVQCTLFDRTVAQFPHTQFVSTVLCWIRQRRLSTNSTTIRLTGALKFLICNQSVGKIKKFIIHVWKYNLGIGFKPK